MELDPTPMWTALLCDLMRDIPPSVAALRFHRGLSTVLVEVAQQLAHRGTPRFETVALSGGCFQNRILFESVAAQLRHLGLVVLTHAQAPANDGGLSLGQAAIAAALLLETRKSSEERTEQCVSAFPVASSR